MVVWKERQHEDDDAKSGADVGSIATLRGCVLLNFSNVPSMRSHVRLLEYILRMWNPEQQYFEVGAHILIVVLKPLLCRCWKRCLRQITWDETQPKALDNPTQVLPYP